MSEWFYLVLTLISGITLGIIYFGGLWFTVLRLPGSRHPMLFALGSFLLRSGIVLAGFYLVAGGQWFRLATCLVGFLIARQVLLYRFRPVQSET